MTTMEYIEKSLNKCFLETLKECFKIIFGVDISDEECSKLMSANDDYERLTYDMHEASDIGCDILEECTRNYKVKD